jgi:hypothetical protein
VRVGHLRPLTADEVRHLPVGARGTITAVVEALTLAGLDTVVPFLKITLRSDIDSGQVMVTADQSVYRTVLRGLRVGHTITVVVRARDDLLHRLLAECITVPNPE